MHKDDLILISVDDHVIEPPDMFVGRLPKKYEDEAPQLVRTRRRLRRLEVPATRHPELGLNAVAGRPKEEYGIEPQGLDEIRPGCYDVHERVKDMSAGGMLASMCFPSFPGFAGRLFATDDQDFSLAAGPGLQRLAHRRVVRRLPGPLHPDGAAGDLGPRAVRGRRSAGSRRRAATRSPSPRTRPRWATRASTASTGTRCGRRCPTPARS